MVDDSLLLVFNTSADHVDLVLPHPSGITAWRVDLDTGTPGDELAGTAYIAGTTLAVAGRTVVVLRATNIAQPTRW